VDEGALSHDGCDDDAVSHLEESARGSVMGDVDYLLGDRELGYKPSYSFGHKQRTRTPSCKQDEHISLGRWAWFRCGRRW
jgi:hypothetical protein